MLAEMVRDRLYDEVEEIEEPPCRECGEGCGWWERCDLEGHRGIGWCHDREAFFAEGTRCPDWE